MWTKSNSLKLSRWLTISFLVLLTIGVITMPFLVKWYLANNGSRDYWTLLITLWVCAVPAYIALFNLLQLLNNLQAEKVLVSENIQYIRRLSWCCFGVCFVFLGSAFFHFFDTIIAVAAAFMGLILRVIKNVFAYAIEIKSENDLTV